MFPYGEWAIAFGIAFLTTIIITYPIKRLAVKLHVMDMPNERKIHTKVTPRLGGLAIFIGVLLGALYLQPAYDHLLSIALGALVILLTGALDDRYALRPVIKLGGQLIASLILISSGLMIDQITLPVIGMVDLGWMSAVVTVIWIIAITNAINLIDGLDGLATGVTTIALLSMFVMALIDGQPFAASLCIILIGANLGFLYHNFYPAYIYMGDTGSNFLGFMIAVVSIVGLFKNIALFSFIMPIIVLAVPIFDTIFAIIRRMYNQQPIMMPDNKHIHYLLIMKGFSHRGTVLVLYVFSALFGLLAVLLSFLSLSAGISVVVLILFLLEFAAELTHLIPGNKQPLMDILKRLWQGRG